MVNYEVKKVLDKTLSCLPESKTLSRTWETLEVPKMSVYNVENK